MCMNFGGGCMRRFLDSNVFLYAYLKPRRKPPQRVLEMKKHAKEIIKRVESGEEVVTSVVHLSEILNILESHLGLQISLQFLETMLSMKNMEIAEVGRKDYEDALILCNKFNISANDGIAVKIMRSLGINEIYSFDSHFDNVPGIKRITR